MGKTISPTNTVTVNAAFLQELKEVNQELWHVLAECRGFCERPGTSQRQCSDFAQQLSELCDQLALHFALEEAYGYFDNPLQVAPQLADRCSALRAEHGALYLELVSLVECAEQLLYEHKLSQFVAQVPPAFQQFHQRVLDHESYEMELIQEAYGSDLGTGD